MTLQEIEEVNITLAILFVKLDGIFQTTICFPPIIPPLFNNNENVRLIFSIPAKDYSVQSPEALYCPVTRYWPKKCKQI